MTVFRRIVDGQAAILRAGGIPPTIAEPHCDILAQLRALFDPASPKDAVFVAAGNEAAIPHGIEGGIKRREGTLFTTSPAKAAAFSRGVNDAELGELLGYPEAKADVFASDSPMMVQALDRDGCVIIEAAASLARLSETVAAFRAYVPEGGRLEMLAPLSAIGRRALLNAQETK